MAPGATPRQGTATPGGPAGSEIDAAENAAAGMTLEPGETPSFDLAQRVSGERSNAVPSGANATEWAAEEPGGASPTTRREDGAAGGGLSEAGTAARQTPLPSPATTGGTAAASMAQSGSPPPAQSDSRSPERSRTPSSATPANASARPKSDLVRRVGKDWALPDHLAGAKGAAVIRTIRVVCYPDRLLLLPPASGGAMEWFGLADGDIRRATLELATAVRDRVSRWGATLPGGRWQPRLEVEVMPHAETRYHQLRTLMSGSGVEVVRVPPKENPAR